jgi:uncharacterized metal-binding protein YceD (DUF177 family)
MSDSTAIEFSRRVLLARVGPQPFRQEIVASETERKALAQRFDLVSLDRLVAQIELAPQGRDMFLLRAAFDADFRQRCVITLDPVRDAVSGQFTLLYGPPEAEDPAPVAVEDDIAFEPLENDWIDVGEAVAQEFSLVLPPFPRVPDADLAAEMSTSDEDANPFAGLSRLLEQRGPETA